VQRLDHRDQPRPWHAALHLAVELLAARALLLHRELDAGETALSHRRVDSVSVSTFNTPRALCDDAAMDKQALPSVA
jgi:hypothetical protein